MTSRVWAAVNPIAGSAVSNGGPTKVSSTARSGTGSPAVAMAPARCSTIRAPESTRVPSRSSRAVRTCGHRSRPPDDGRAWVCRAVRCRRGRFATRLRPPRRVRQFPEHTRAAYDQAVADGADGVECDVHLTADGEVVLIHDGTLDRTSDGTGPVATHTLAELRDLDIWSWKGVALPQGAARRPGPVPRRPARPAARRGPPDGAGRGAQARGAGGGPALEDAVLGGVRTAGLGRGGEPARHGRRPRS